MGGLGAFFHEKAYPGEVNGLILLAPFVGDDLKLFAEIDAAGGPSLWAGFNRLAAPNRNRPNFKGNSGVSLAGSNSIKTSASDLGCLWRCRSSAARNRALRKPHSAGARISVTGRAHLGSLDNRIHENSGERNCGRKSEKSLPRSITEDTEDRFHHKNTEDIEFEIRIARQISCKNFKFRGSSVARRISVRNIPPSVSSGFWFC